MANSGSNTNKSQLWVFLIESWTFFGSEIVWHNLVRQFHHIPFVQTSGREAHGVRSTGRWNGHTQRHGTHRHGQQGPARWGNCHRAGPGLHWSVRRSGWTSKFSAPIFLFLSISLSISDVNSWWRNAQPPNRPKRSRKRSRLRLSVPQPLRWARSPKLINHRASANTSIRRRTKSNPSLHYRLYRVTYHFLDAAGQKKSKQSQNRSRKKPKWRATRLEISVIGEHFTSRCPTC